MKDNLSRKIAMLVIGAGCISLAGCASMPTTKVMTNTSPATVAYVMDPSVAPSIMGFSTLPADNGSLVSNLSLPPSPEYCCGPLATDPSGQIYVATALDGSSQASQVLVYPAGSSGAAVPTRSINVSGVNRIAVDPAGRVYVLNLAQGNGWPTVDVYSATASGAAKPIRSLQLTNVVPVVEDIAADAEGDIFCACFFENGWAVAVYSGNATGPSVPSRIISFGTSSSLYGVAVDTAGDVFVNVCNGCYSSANAIEEFAPGANGSAVPVRTINLTVAAPWEIVSGGPVRVDGAGNIFTSLEVMNHDTTLTNIFVYGFAATATGSEAPTVQIVPERGYNTFLAVN